MCSSLRRRVAGSTPRRGVDFAALPCYSAWLSLALAFSRAKKLVPTDRRAFIAKISRHPAGWGKVLIGEDDRDLARMLGGRHIGGRWRNRGIGGRWGWSLIRECCADGCCLGNWSQPSPRL